MEIEGEVFYVYVVKRPGVEEFLERMHKIYEIVIYTASLSIYADPLLDEIDPSNYASYRLFREHCTFYNNAFVKDLSQLGRDLKNVIIVDNSPASYLFQPENAVPILTWTDDMDDVKLFELSSVLELMAHAGDVRETIQQVVKGDSIDYIEAAEILKRKFAPKPRPLLNAWAEPVTKLESARKTESLPRKKSPPEQPIKPSTEKYLSMGPLTPQYKKASVGLMRVSQAEAEVGNGLKKKISVKKIVAPEESAKSIKKGSKMSLENAGTEDSPSKKRPMTEHSEKRKKSSTPTPYSTSGLHKANGKPGKMLPLHKQPRQHSAAGKRKGESTRSATPKNGTPKKEPVEVPQTKAHNPAPSKAGLFYSNLLRIKGDHGAKTERETCKENCAVAGGTLPTKAKPCILTGSNILRGLEESANKKLNKHSSSLDNTDWMACYEKLRKELNLNSPKDVPVSGRVSVNSVRPSGVVLLGEYLPKRQLVTPTPNPFPASKQSKIQASVKLPMKANKEKSKPMLVANNEKFANMMVQIGGKQAVLDKGVQRPVVFSRLKR